MRVNVNDIGDGGIGLTFEESAESFPSLLEISRGGECVFLMPLTIDLRIRRIGQLFEATGRFETRVRLLCSRCLADYETPLAADFILSFSREQPEAADPSQHAEIELGAEEIGLILFHGEEIDLRDAVQEEVLMAVPMKTLCRPECKGLCPQCGTDLNQDDCGCERKTINPKFAVLKGLKLGKK
ncbi:MAG: DUF177 domain-containing protein [Desulfobacterales bacterium]|nr:DUF177 domain-containing protein [Desulfobacterales bacterium]